MQAACELSTFPVLMAAQALKATALKQALSHTVSLLTSPARSPGPKLNVLPSVQFSDKEGKIPFDVHVGFQDRVRLGNFPSCQKEISPAQCLLVTRGICGSDFCLFILHFLFAVSCLEMDAV